MAVSKKKTYQYVITEDECQLFNFLRRCENDSIELFPLKDHPRLYETASPLAFVTLLTRTSKQTFNLSFNIEGRRARHYAIDPHQIVQESATWAAQYLRELLTDHAQVDEEEPLVAATNTDEQPTNSAFSHPDERDSVLGTQSVIEGPGTQQDDSEIMSWELFREKFVPSSVKVTFDISSMDVSQEDEIRQRFSGVDFTRGPLRAPEPGRDVIDSSKRPQGVKSMVIELDEKELSQTPGIENKVREQYPWATFQTTAGPNTSRKRVPSSTGQNVANGQQLDPVRHLRDFAEYTSEAPTTQEFELYNSQVFEGWDTLEFHRKIDVAHARAIQSRYGKVVDGGGCGHCVQGGYKCKAYVAELHVNSTMELGASCQNCRLKGITCDLTPVAKAQPAPSFNVPNPQVLRLDTNETTITRPRDATITPSTAATHKPSLASRITLAETGTSIKGASALDDEETSGSVSGSTSKSVDTGTPNSAVHTSPILNFAESIGIQISSHVGKVIHAMYTNLSHHREVRAYAPRALKLEHYYSNLVILYILAYRKGEFDLAYIVLLRFQNTNYNRTGTLPGIELAVQAFEHLPPDSALCQWLAILYSFLWGTQSEGVYEKFTSDHPDLHTLALNKLLYAVAYVRDPFTEGHDAAVLTRWCNVHDHADGSPEQRLCEKAQVGLKIGLQEALESEKARMLVDAQETVEKSGGVVTFNTRTEELSQSSPANKGKRKFESSPARPFKKGKRGGGYGMGR